MSNSLVEGVERVAVSTVFDGTEQTLEVRELLYKLGSTFSTYVILHSDPVPWDLT